VSSFLTAHQHIIGYSYIFQVLVLGTHDYQDKEQVAQASLTLAHKETNS